MKCDVAGYFRSVDHEVLLALLARRIGDSRLLALLKSLIAHGAVAPGIGMPIGSLTSKMFANLYLHPLDHFVKEGLRVRHYIRYMDDFVILVDDRAEARRRLAEVEAFLGERLHLRLNPRRRHVAPLSAPCDFLGYVHRPGGPTRVRRRNVRRLRRRLPALEGGLDAGTADRLSARSSLASWVGLAGHADAFRLRGRSSRSAIRATSASACWWVASRSLVRPLTGQALAERRTQRAALRQQERRGSDA